MGMKFPPQILIADDDAQIRVLIEGLVKRTLPDARITAVENGRKALEHFKKHGADLVISNFIMPEMDGPTFVASLREMRQDLPVIMVSGSPEAEPRGRAAGIDVFVDKLELMKRLPCAIKTLLEPHGLACPGPSPSG